MDELSKKYVISFFDKNLMLHGDRPEAVRWSPKRQILHKDFELHYTSPEDIFNFAATKLSPIVSLRHDRIVCDFTLFVYKDINKY
jgi:hypothetical protein